MPSAALGPGTEPLARGCDPTYRRRNPPVREYRMPSRLVAGSRPPRASGTLRAGPDGYTRRTFPCGSGGPSPDGGVSRSPPWADSFPSAGPSGRRLPWCPPGGSVFLDHRVRSASCHARCLSRTARAAGSALIWVTRPRWIAARRVGVPEPRALRRSRSHPRAPERADRLYEGRPRKRDH